MKSELLECDFTAPARIKGKSAENQWQSALGSASCAYWADMQLYRTTGSVQQEQESSPLSSKAEHTGPLSTGGGTVGTTSNLRKCVKIKTRFSVLACTSVGNSLFNPNQKLCNVPAYIYLSVPGCWRQTNDRNLAPNGVRMSSNPFLFRREDAAQPLSRRPCAAV